VRTQSRPQATSKGRSDGNGSSSSKSLKAQQKTRQDELEQRKQLLEMQLAQINNEMQLTQGNVIEGGQTDDESMPGDDDDDDGENYMLSQGISGDRPSTNGPTEQNRLAMEQLQKERLMEQQQGINKSAPSNESTRDKAVREQREEFEGIKRKLHMSSSPFAEPLRECMQYFENKALAMERDTNNSVKIMEVNSPPSATMDGVTYTVQEMLAIAPHDSNIGAWAADTILDVKIGIVNAKIGQHKAYIAPIAELGMFMFRDDGYYSADGQTRERLPGESLSHARTRNLIADRNNAIDRANDSSDPRANPFDATLYPAGCMPIDTRSLLLVYNISNTHWVLVEVEVNAAKTIGFVRLYNTLSGPEQGKRGDAYATVKHEIPEILKLIQRRPDLGWDRVQFNGDIPELKACPQQDNSTDCGFWSVFLAEQLAKSEPLSEGVLTGVEGALRGKVLRWEIMKDVYQGLMNKQLASAGPVKHAAALGRENRGNGKGNGKGTSKGNDKGIGKSKGKVRGKGKSRRNPEHTQTPALDDVDLDPEADPSDSEHLDSWKQLDGYKFDLRQIIGDILGEEDGYVPQDAILDEVLSRVQALAAEHEADIQGQESVIRERACAVLERSTRSFMRLDVLSPAEAEVEDTITEGGPWYRLDPGPARSVSTAAKEVFLSTPEEAPQLLDPITIDFLLTISIARASGPQRYEEDFQKLRVRSEDQVSSYHKSFGPQTPIPRNVQTWDGMTDRGLDKPSWTDYVFTGSSNDVLFGRDSTGQSKTTGNRMRKLLEDLNAWAKTQPHRQRVALLWSGTDGGTSNNETWPFLQEQYPDIDFYVVIVQPSFRCWNRAYFHVDKEADNCWAAFDVDTLASLQRGDEITQDNCRPADLPEWRFLMAANLIAYLKDDCSLRGTHGDALHVMPSAQNRVAAQLTGSYRKLFALSEGNKVCELRHVDADEDLTWSRGRSTDVAVICDRHIDADDDQRIAESAIIERATASDVQEQISPDLVCPFAKYPHQGHGKQSKSGLLWSCRYCDRDFEGPYLLATHMTVHPEVEDDLPFGCTLCDMRFSTNGLLDRHQKVHADDRPHFCTKCDACFKGYEGLKLHMRTIHPIPEGEWHGLHQCEECGAEFEWLHQLETHCKKHDILCSICDRLFEGVNGPKNLRIHMRTTHSDDRPYACTVCWSLFKRACELRAHLELIHNSNLGDHDDRDRPHVCIAPGCDERFSQPTLLAKHVAVHHDIRPLGCTLCPQRFKRKYDLDQHIRNVHRDPTLEKKVVEKSHVCTHPGCESRFAFQKDLKAHMVTHSDERPFGCTLCSKTFKLKGPLTAHMLTHSDEHPFKCTLCSVTFKRVSQLNDHTKTVHKDGNVKDVVDFPHKCTHPGCGTSFEKKSNLKGHMAIHSDERPFKCTLCPSDFKVKSVLKRHMKDVHHVVEKVVDKPQKGDKPFACTHPGCNSRFEYESRLKTHMATHSDERPFECTLCPMTFKVKRNLTSHMKDVHKKKK
jgi:uncharacterized Zn-finger protein